MIQKLKLCKILTFFFLLSFQILGVSKNSNAIINRSLYDYVNDPILSLNASFMIYIDDIRIPGAYISRYIRSSKPRTYDNSENDKWYNRQVNIGISYTYNEAVKRYTSITPPRKNQKKLFENKRETIRLYLGNVLNNKTVEYLRKPVKIYSGTIYKYTFNSIYMKKQLKIVRNTLVKNIDKEKDKIKRFEKIKALIPLYVIYKRNYPKKNFTKIYSFLDKYGKEYVDNETDEYYIDLILSAFPNHNLSIEIKAQRQNEIEQKRRYEIELQKSIIAKREADKLENERKKAKAKYYHKIAYEYGKPRMKSTSPDGRNFNCEVKYANENSSEINIMVTYSWNGATSHCNSGMASLFSNRIPNYFEEDVYLTINKKNLDIKPQRNKSNEAIDKCEDIGNNTINNLKGLTALAGLYIGTIKLADAVGGESSGGGYISNETKQTTNTPNVTEKVSFVNLILKSSNVHMDKLTLCTIIGDRYEVTFSDGSKRKAGFVRKGEAGCIKTGKWFCKGNWSGNIIANSKEELIKKIKDYYEK
ncbi:MAG: hypothetical protein ACPGSD_12045 [Flavobacteriales bacterium]|jgi:hypothetical protein